MQAPVRAGEGTVVRRAIGTYSRRHIDLQRSSSALCTAA
ncbi:putative leader peptide [Streptacidiphilus cavernicola]|uniref:Leader peptide n=1 Tax=Streptacidiphilus cavernicola TaxID=3342716 RepID=A0ABV6W5F2_9ACTN